MYHGRRWNTDPRFSAPMISISNEVSVFVRDCVTFLHPQLGPTVGIVVQFFQTVCGSIGLSVMNIYEIAGLEC